MPPITHDYLLPALVKGLDQHLEILRDNGEVDSELNYLYFLRDEVNKRIKAENNKRKKEA